MHLPNPISALFGPIFQKEVRTSGRRRGTYLFRALYTLGLLVLVGVSFEGMRNSAAMFSGVQRLQTLQQLAPQLALIIVWFQFIALALAAPIFTGPAISDEKRARTLSALLTTPLSAAQIVCGKLASRVVQLVILALMATPLLLAIRVFGGLDASIVIAATAIAITTAILGAALGLMYSCWHKRGSSAAVFAILSLVLVQGGPSAVEGILFYTLNTSVDSPEPEYPFHKNILATCSPAALGLQTIATAAGAEILPEVALEGRWLAHVPGAVAATNTKGVTYRFILGPTWVVNALWNLALAAAVTLYTTAALRRIMRREAAGEGAAAAPKRRRRRSPSPLAVQESPVAQDPESGPLDPEAGLEDATCNPQSPALGNSSEAHDDTRDRNSRTISDHPVFWREVRQATLGSRRRFIIIAAIAVLALLILYWRVGLEDEGLHQSLAIIGALAVMLQPVFMTTGSIAGEREARTWEVLLTTPLRGRSILFGKAAGALRAQWFLPTLILGHFVLAAATGNIHPIIVPLLFFIYLGPILFFTATGQLFSLLFRKSTVAAVCNLLLGLGLWLGTWIAMGLAAWCLDPDSETMNSFTQLNFQLNPAAMTTSACSGALDLPRVFSHRSMVARGFSIPGDPDLNLSAWAFTLHAAVVCAIYAAAAIYALSIATAVFPRLGGRSWSPLQKSEEGLATVARIATAVLIAIAGAAVGWAAFRLPGGIAGLVGAVGFLAWLAARERSIKAAAEGPRPGADKKPA